MLQDAAIRLSCQYDHEARVVPIVVNLSFCDPVCFGYIAQAFKAPSCKLATRTQVQLECEHVLLQMLGLRTRSPGIRGDTQGFGAVGGCGGRISLSRFRAECMERLSTGRCGPGVITQSRSRPVLNGA